MTQTPGSPKPQRRRGLRIALVLSVMLNLLLVGLLAGGALRAARLEATTGGRPDLSALWRALPDETRDALRDTLRGSGAGSAHHRPDRAERRARAALLNAALVEALRTEAFDAERFASLLSGDRDEAARRIDAAHRELAARVAALPGSDRAALADRFESNLRRSGRR